MQPQHPLGWGMTISSPTPRSLLAATRKTGSHIYTSLQGPVQRGMPGDTSPCGVRLELHNFRKLGKKAGCSEVDAGSRLDDQGCTPREAVTAPRLSPPAVPHWILYNHLKLSLEYQRFYLRSLSGSKRGSRHSEYAHSSARRAREESQTRRLPWTDGWRGSHL